MEKFFRKSIVIYTLTLALVLFVDILTKRIAELYLAKGELTLLPFLHLVLVYNRGAAFGILSETEGVLRFLSLILVPLLAVLLTLWYAIREDSWYMSIVMGAIAGGALGNLYDRFFLGYVRDFIYLQYGKLSWPAFNVADMSISLAVFAFFLMHYIKSKRVAS